MFGKGAPKYIWSIQRASEGKQREKRSNKPRPETKTLPKEIEKQRAPI